MVLHGASGLSNEVVQECINQGICKVNFATELRIAYTKAVQDFLSKDPNSIDPKKYGTVAREAVKQLVIERIRVLGSDGKAV
jgi:tagatose 1,6-diphosphate aldolase GatY/KbaY